MAQTSSAQREPSMEEILASIRRIIEDSDQTRQPSGEPEPANDAPPVPKGVVEVEAFRAELRDAAMVADDVPPTLAAIQAQLSAAPQPSAEKAAEGAGAPGGPDAASEESGRRHKDDIDRFDEMLDDEMSKLSAAVPVSAAAREEPVAEPRNAIISDHAGRQVAAAFEELSEAFAASRQKDFDGMAEAMMRPMLQDWLDNNLPVLVERLVREEIERVARGTGR